MCPENQQRLKNTLSVSMKHMRIQTYIILLSVFLLSFWLSSHFHTQAIMKNIVALPAVCALIAAIYQIFRDHSAHLKQLELQQKQQNFSLGVSSYMAQVAFDKHVEFCEKYIAEVHKTSNTLWGEGPSEKAIEDEKTLAGLRIEYSTWVTDDVSNKLRDFEKALYIIGSKTRLSEKTKNSELAEKAYAEADHMWEKMIGSLLNKKNSQNENVAVESIINKIRDILGIRELIELRGLLIKTAVSTIKNT